MPYLSGMDPVALREQNDVLGLRYMLIFSDNHAQRFFNYVVLLVIAAVPLYRRDISCVSTWLIAMGRCLVFQLVQRCLHMFYTSMRVNHYTVLHACWSASVGVYTPQHASSRALRAGVYIPMAVEYLNMVHSLFGSRASLPNGEGETIRLVVHHPSLIILDRYRPDTNCTSRVSYYPRVGVKTAEMHEDMQDPSLCTLFTRQDMNGRVTSLDRCSFFVTYTEERQMIRDASTTYKFLYTSHSLDFYIEGLARNTYPIRDNKLSDRDYLRAKKRLQTLMNPQTRAVLPSDLWSMVLDYFLFLPEMPFPQGRIMAIAS